MAEIYGHRFVSQYGATPLDTWRDGLADLSGVQIAEGLAACARATEFAKWPPNLLEFRDMCLFGDLPELEPAFRNAVRNVNCPAELVSWADPAIYHAAISAGFYALRTLAEREARHAFGLAYAAVRKRVAAGEVLAPVPVASLPKPLPAKPSPEVARGHLEKLRAALTGREVVQ